MGVLTSPPGDSVQAQVGGPLVIRSSLCERPADGWLQVNPHGIAY